MMPEMLEFKVCMECGYKGEEMEKEMAALKAEREWVPLSTQPPYCKAVWWLCDNGNVYEGYGGDGRSLDRFTHWYPRWYPEPPQQGGE